MKEVFTSATRQRLGRLLADCQKRVNVNCRRIRVEDIYKPLGISPNTFYKARRA